MSVATDNVIATIASILDLPQPDLTPESEASAPPETAKPTAEPAPAAPVAKAPVEADGYTKTGPGPMAALRFKWTVRRGDDGYYVDETIGRDSSPVSNGPMEAEAAITFVDERADGAKAHFEALKSEMTGHGPPAPMLAWTAGEK